MKISQAPSAIVMVRPKAFGFNLQTATTNSFQNHGHDSLESIQDKARAEFDTMVDLLRSNDIEVTVIEDTVQPEKPDAIFPNNWISFHHDGTVVLYPMMAENRRKERSIPLLEAIKKDFSVTNTFDFSDRENQNHFLEGTGSIVFDYVNKIAYASRSMRTDEGLLKELCDRLGFNAMIFDAVNEHKKPVYHTNVLMCIGTQFVIICLDAIYREEDQEMLLESFSRTHHKVIAISFEQMNAFAGNMLEVKSKSGETFILMSQKAYYALLPGQLDALSKFAEPLMVAIPTIEEYGGGSVRCMMAGIFNPVR